MQAIVVTEFGGPEVLQLREVDDPQPGPGQVRVRIHAAGVNPVETYIRTGTYARKPALPYTPGTDGAGIVDAVGPGVTRVKPGDRVFLANTLARCSGTYAQLAICDEAGVHPLPESVTFAQGAAIGIPACTAWRALFQKAAARASEVVLVHGASGSVGTSAVQLAAAAGLTVIATAGSERGRKLAAEQGAHFVFDHGEEGYRDRIVEATGGRGPDIILEMLANVNLGHDLAMIAPRGRVVIVGSRGSLELMPRLFMARDCSAVGMTLFNANEAEWREITAGVSAALAAGTLRPVVNRRLPLARAAEAHQLVMQSGAAGKIVLEP
ncbi:MAG TPA: NADPH:quinone reductase [Vicinamibacterales bacterium]